MYMNQARWFGEEFAESILKWFSQTLMPDEIFDKQYLIDYMKKEYLPEDVFTDAQLINWAEENDYYTKE